MQLNEPPLGTLPPLHARFERCRTAFDADRLPDHRARRAALDALETLLQQHRHTFADAIAADFSHRARQETLLLEVFPALSAIRHARAQLRKWMRPQRRWASLWFLPARTELRPQPLGVVGIVVPWNYPLLLAVAPLVGALAAGNRVMVKMSEFTPRTSALFAQLIADAFPADHVTVVEGDADVARAFTALPFDHLLFTGSTAVGRQVMRAAAEHLTPVTLELGGKSPAIVGPEADLDEAARKILFGKCLNAGQTCIAPDYVLLPRHTLPAFADAARRAVAATYPRLADNPDYTAIVNPTQRARLMRLLDEAAARGATVEAINPANESFDASQKLPPTLVWNAPDDCALMREEIFGPLLPLVGYDTLDDAIAHINARPRPLALYYFGFDDAHIERVLDRTVAGGVTLNDTILHISQDHLPFGGVGPSGMGAYHGRHGFEAFSKLKPVFRQSRINAIGMMMPPYGRRLAGLLKLLLR